MKKLGLILAAAFPMLFAACSEDNHNIPGEDDFVNVSFSTMLDQSAMTRGVTGESDGSNATKLYVAVYNASGNLIPGISKIGENTETMSENEASVSFQLVKGQTYNFAFWAQNPEATTGALTFDAAAKTVTVDYTKIKANDESLDAFTAHVNNLTVTGPVTQSVTLKRPWAQLNYGTTSTDWAAAEAAGITVTRSKVTVSNVYRTLKLLEGTVADAATADIVLEAANIPTHTLTVSNTDYKQLGLNYLLVGNEGEQGLIKADLTVLNADGEINTLAFSNIPVQRNYRTNIVGNLLTSQVEFNVNIDPLYENDYNPVFSVVKTGIAKDGIGNYVVSTEVEDKATAINDILTDAKESGISDVKVILPDGEYSAKLYSGSSIGISSLTIAGNGNTKVKFNDQQVMLSLLDELVIENCEIEHMATKSWGMCVFGGSGKANGVYTIRNCTFNGVNTQGIYINETASGATYNIENCTFDGNFGTEGAITIQNNANVNHTVNIKGCTFSNIPESSHEVFIIYDYDGWTLNAEGNTGLDATSASDIFWKTNN